MDKHFDKNVIINNSLSSEYINLTRGGRQSGPWSPYLFLLPVDTSEISVTENVEMKGIVIERQKVKLLRSADDTTAVVSDIESAYKLNFFIVKQIVQNIKFKGKKKIYLVGSLKGKETKPLEIKWPRDLI